MQTIKFKLTIAYDGGGYEGWQIQKTGTGVQQKLEEALGKIFPEKPCLHSSSRTDTGVHALGMVAHFEVPANQVKMNGRKLGLALNAWLPEDIRVVNATRARPEFHARFDATGKEYRYYVWNHRAMNPLLRGTAWHFPRALNLEEMRRAARGFVGRHDFRGFTSNPGYARTSTIRTVTRCEVKKSGRLLTFIIRGDGFLYKMCRGMVGTLVQAGQGKFESGTVLDMLRKKDRRVSGMTAPAHGLVLWKVFYPLARGGEALRGKSGRKIAHARGAR